MVSYTEELGRYRILCILNRLDCVNKFESNPTNGLARSPSRLSGLETSRLDFNSAFFVSGILPSASYYKGFLRVGWFVI